MRKIKSKFITFLCLFACLLIIPAQVYAASKAVTVSSAKASLTTIEVSGTSEALAVMIQVRDTDDNIIVMKSFGTEDKKFTGKIENLKLKEGATYKIYAADYEGGDWTITEVVATADVATAPAPTKSAPTGDTQTRILWTCVLAMGVCLATIGAIYFKKKEY